MIDSNFKEQNSICAYICHKVATKSATLANQANQATETLMLLQLLLQIWWLTLASASFAGTKPGCQSTCGNVAIPYPFGMGEEGCSINAGYGYHISCNTSYDPPRPFIGTGTGTGTLEVVNISGTELRVKNLIANFCVSASSGLGMDAPLDANTDVSRTPFTFSSTRNRFIAIGCNTFAIFDVTNGRNFTSGCVSTCGSSREDVVEGSCSGIGCCQTIIPKGLTQFSAQVTTLQVTKSSIWSFSPCSYAFLGEEERYTFSASDLSEDQTKFLSRSRDIPLVLDWAIRNKTCEEAKQDLGTFACQENSDCYNSDNAPGYLCSCDKGYEGNPYLSNGCQDVNECEDPNNNPCNGNCTNTKGSYFCFCPKGSHGDGKRDGQGCIPNNKEFPIISVTLGIGLGLLFVLIASSSYYLRRKKRILKKLKERFYELNGGLLFEQLISQHEGCVESTNKIFTAEELKLATKNYAESQILGEGGNGTVYKGTLSDNRVVAIKKSKNLNDSQIEEFINEVVILTQINHRNVVRLLGCCLETEIPLLVYEFISNGTLNKHIHTKHGTSLISWENRLRIAAETAGALAYLHSAASVPIVHRDIKSANILLDENYTAKVADFGASRLIPLDQTQIITVVLGTLGYLDPEYFQTSQLTAKSDVYSFGVVLVELLTGEEPLCTRRSEEQQFFPSYFLSSMTENNLFKLLAAQVVNEGEKDQILAISELVKRCLSMTSEERPTMKEVAGELQGMMRTETHPWNKQSHDETENLLNPEPLDLYTVPAGSSHTATFSRQYSLENAMIMSTAVPR